MKTLFPVIVCLTLVGCGGAGQPQPAAPAATNWAATRDGLIEEYLKAHPAYAVYQGRHEYDGMLPDWSSSGIAAEVMRLHAWRDKAAAVSSLGSADAVERDALVARYDRDLFWLETAEAPFTNPAWYLDWIVDNIDPAPYLTRTYAPLDQRMIAYTKYARAVQQAASQIRANLRTPLAQPLAERGISAFGGLASFYSSDVPKVFAEVKDEALHKEFAEANAGAARAMADLAAWLKSQLPTANASFALGPEKFSKMLAATEGVTTPLAELEAAGRADMARNQQAMREACAAFAPGATITACIAKMNANKAPGSVVEGARAQLAGLKKFVADAGVASIPGPEEAKVAESPPYNSANSAYIDIPGPYEKGQASIYYIAPPDPSWTAKEQQEYLPGRADLLFTSVHEVWPGHFLQFLHSNRNPSLVARLFVGYAFAEGWAHYAEEMMWEMGLGNGDAETHVGQLTNALLRNARFLSAIGLHTQGMTVAASEKMFREQAYSDVGTARQQAARGTYDPAYLNYTMGKLMIRKLRDDWTGSRGGRASWGKFHDEFLSHAGPTIPLVRQQLMGNANGPLF
jgi:uncharacterized protein (DUF885 family)